MQKVLDKYSRRFITNLHRTFLAKFRIQINNRIIYVSKKKTRSLSYNNIVQYIVFKYRAISSDLSYLDLEEAETSGKAWFSKRSSVIFNVARERLATPLGGWRNGRGLSRNTILGGDKPANRIPRDNRDPGHLEGIMHAVFRGVINFRSGRPAPHADGRVKFIWHRKE